MRRCSSIGMQAQAKDRLKDLLHNILEGLLRNPPTEWSIRPDSYRQSPETVKQRLTRLTPEERKAVLMSRLGYPHEEIAVRMNISIECLRAHLHKAYLTLKTSVSEPEQE